MNSWLHIHWGQAFTFSVSPIEIFIRGAIVFLAVFTLLRVILRRTITSRSPTACCSWRRFSAGHSYGTGRAFKYSWFQKLLDPPTLELAKDGKINHRNMRRELITRDELMPARLEGLTKLEEVKRVSMESAGGEIQWVDFGAYLGP